MPTPGELSHSAWSETRPGSPLEDVPSLSQTVHFTGVNRILRSLLKSHTNLRLRTKLLLSLAMSTTALTCATLLVVRHSAQAQAQRQIEQDARNAFLTIQAVQQQREIMLSRKAGLLATLAYLRDGDATTIQDASQDPWQSDDCDLFALADRKGKITAVHTTSSRLQVADAEKLFRSSLKEHSREGWWFVESLLDA